MYPYEIFPGVDLYTLLLCVGILAALLVFRLVSDKLRLPVKLQTMALLSGICAIVLGYFSAVLFQAFYNIERNGGKLIIDAETGATFYGGLIGGALVFFLAYFIAGHFLFPKKEHFSYFYTVADTAVTAVAIAHSLGRFGCLMAGCCYGRATDAWYGIEMLIGGTWQRVIPTQLFEAIFLLLMFGCFLYLVLHRKGYCLELYLVVYGVWRFFIEYIRADYRGTTLVSLFTPSQLTALLMVIGGAALIFVRRRLTSLPLFQAVGAAAGTENSDDEDA